MKKKVTIVALIALLLVLLTGVFFFILLKVTAEETSEEAKAPIDITMFSAYTEHEAYQNIPAMQTENGKFSKVEDYGKKDYLMNVSGSTVEEYKAYLTTLEQAGFKKHSDNGEDAMEGYAYTASFTKDDLAFTVSHAIREDHTYLVASPGDELSPHLIYDDNYMDGVTEDSKTSVHMLELHSNGNSFNNSF